MSVTWQLWMLFFRRTPLLLVLAQIFAAAALLFTIQWLRGESSASTIAAPLFGTGTWLWHIGQGQGLRTVCVPESFLLPRFRRRLLEYGAVDLLLWVAVPLGLIACGSSSHLPLIGSSLLLTASLGITMGCHPRASMLLWPVFILFGWMPRLVMTLAKEAIHSPLMPWLLLAVAMLLLRLSLAPLQRIGDRETDTSPLESTSLGRIARRTPGEQRRSGFIGKRITALYDYAAQRAMQRALRAYRKHPSRVRRIVLVRRLLLPHDNFEAMLLRITLVAVLVCLYFLALMHREHFQPAVVGGYAIMLSISRFPQLNIGMVRMRPNMADLYLTLAPGTRAEYQKTIADALLVLVPITMATALIYTSLGAILVHAPDPWHMLFVAAVVSAGASPAALALHLIGPEGATGRTVANAIVVFGVMAVYWGGYWLVGMAGYLIGGGTLALVAIGFGASVWFAAQREYQTRVPRFDAPMG